MLYIATGADTKESLFCISCIRLLWVAHLYDVTRLRLEVDLLCCPFLLNLLTTFLGKKILNLKNFDLEKKFLAIPDFV